MVYITSLLVMRSYIMASDCCVVVVNVSTSYSNMRNSKPEINHSKTCWVFSSLTCGMLD
jgi:hypothetical protein